MEEARCSRCEAGRAFDWVAASAASRTGDRRQQRGRVGDAARHRTGGVLRMRDRDDAAAADEAHRRLDADQAGHRRRADDAAVGLGTDADRGQACGDRATRAGARPAGVAIQCVGAVRLSAASAPARGRARRAEIRPFAEVGLAQDHRPGGTQPLDEEGVLLRMMVRQCQRAGGVHHRGRVDVVLQQHGNAVQRASRPTGLARGIARIGFLQRLRD